MDILVVKRNGSLDSFNKHKIISAINKAFLEVDRFLYSDEIAILIADEIEKRLLASIKPEDDCISIEVETLQDWVENELMESERKDVARAYIRYRYRQEVAREKKDELIKAVIEKLNAANVQNQNANVDEHSFGGRTGEASSAMTRQLALDLLLSKRSRENHINNRVYIHDLDAYYIGSHNCLSVPFDSLLAPGFNTRQTDVRPAGSINTAMQLIAVLFQLQSLQQFGGVSSTHLDWTMVPFVRKSFAKHFLKGMKYIENNGVIYDKKELEKLSIDAELYKEQPKAYQYALDMTKEELDQAVEGLYHNLNTLQSRSGN